MHADGRNPIHSHGSARRTQECRRDYVQGTLRYRLLIVSRLEVVARSANVTWRLGARPDTNRNAPLLPSMRSFLRGWCRAAWGFEHGGRSKSQLARVTVHPYLYVLCATWVPVPHLRPLWIVSCVRYFLAPNCFLLILAICSL